MRTYESEILVERQQRLAAVTYVQHSRAWYASRAPLAADIVDDVLVECHATGNGFKVQWVQLPGARRPSPQLCVFDDGMQFLASVAGLLLPAMAALPADYSPTELCMVLVNLGAVDATPPYAPGSLAARRHSEQLHARMASE